MIQFSPSAKVDERQSPQHSNSRDERDEAEYSVLRNHQEHKPAPIAIGPLNSGEVVDESPGTSVKQSTPLFRPDQNLQSIKKTMPTIGSAKIRSGRITKTLQKTNSVEFIASTRKEEEIVTHRDTLTERHH